MTTPPEHNSIRRAAQRYKHWRGHEEIVPGYWLVEEGSGPKASKRRLAVIYYATFGWAYAGFCETWDERARLQLWLKERSWELTGPASELCPMLSELVKRYA